MYCIRDIYFSSEKPVDFRAIIQNKLLRCHQMKGFPRPPYKYDAQLKNVTNCIHVDFCKAALRQYILSKVLYKSNNIALICMQQNCKDYMFKANCARNVTHSPSSGLILSFFLFSLFFRQCKFLILLPFNKQEGFLLWLNYQDVSINMWAARY